MGETVQSVHGNELDELRYVGTFERQLDPRNRVTIPSDWRVPGDDRPYYLAWPNPDPDRCVTFYPPEIQRQWLARARNIQQSDGDGQKLLSHLFGAGFKMGLDKVDRILLPPALITHAGIVKSITLVGLGTHFQLWSTERHRLEQGRTDFNLLKVMKQFGF